MRPFQKYPETVMIGRQEFKIGKRIPFNLWGEQTFAANAGGTIPFPDGTFNLGISMPFEVDTIIPRPCLMSGDPLQPIADPAPSIYKFGILEILAQGINQEFQRAATRLDGLVDARRRMWEIEPFHVFNQQSFRPRFQNVHPTAQMRLGLNFQGSLLVITPTRSSQQPFQDQSRYPLAGQPTPLPEVYIDRNGTVWKIGLRVPHVLHTELTLAAASAPSQFPANELTNGNDQPFEATEIIIRATQLDAQGQPIADPVPSIFEFFRIGFKAQGITTDFQTQLVRASSILDEDERMWRIPPMTIESSQSFVATGQNDHPDHSLRLEVSFRGNHLYLQTMPS